jgi:hypothetical protein
MPDIILPPSLNFARARFRLVENVGVSRALYTGKTRTSELGGDRVACSLEATPSMSAQRAALKALTMQAGRRNRVFLYDPGYRPRGSFPANELLTNADFSQGTTGWLPGGNGVISAANGVMRTRRASTGGLPQFYKDPQVAVAQNVPYLHRAFVSAHRGPLAFRTYTDTGGTITQSLSLNGVGLAQAVVIPTASLAYCTHFDVGDVGTQAGDYFDVPFVSLSRCVLSDNAPNSLLHSDDFSNAAWVKDGTTVIANTGAVLAPDGTSTADTILEDSSTGPHYVYQVISGLSSSAFDVCYSVALRAGTRTWGRVQISELATSAVQAWFNLSTGTLGGVNTTGTGFVNPRHFIRALGNDWYQCTLVARKAGTFTSLAPVHGPTTGDGVSTYAGTTVGLYGWRGTLALSGVPTRLSPTTTTAVPNGTAQTGAAIHVKGLPASTNGLLLAGDWVEIITTAGSELKMVTASLDSDAAGLGYLQFAPALRGTVADNAPIIVHRPTGRFISTSDALEYLDEPGIVTTSSFDFEEA